MKKVLLLGDSIREWGYGPRVEELLSPDFLVWHAPDNGRFAAYTLRCVFDWKEQMQGADVIHWNNGLWDVCDLFGDGPFTPIDQYVATMVRIARVLKTYAPAVIFATTTVTSPAMWGHDAARTKLYNDAVVAALVKEGVYINDLHAIVSADTGGMICDDLIHLSPRGIEACAAQVAKAIREAATDNH